MARPRSDIAERLVIAARARFLAQGVDGASLREIAKEAGTTIGMVYYYFPMKDDLFIAVVEPVYARLLTDVVERVAPLRDGEPFEPQLQRLYRRLWELSEEEFAVVGLLLRELMTSSERIHRVAQLFLAGHLPPLARFLAEGIAAGQLRDDVPPVAQLVTLMGMGMLPVLVSRVVKRGGLIGEGDLPPPDALAAIFSGIWLRGNGSAAAAREEPKRKRPARR
jgi:AcrR family transcriptional regulator